MTDADIPLTKPNVPSLWRQAEYVACMNAGIGFTGHGVSGGSLNTLFHYKFPDKVVTLVVGIAAGGEWGVVKRIDHTFKPGIDWTEQVRREMIRRGEN